MIMPCMNSTSALNGALGGVHTVVSLRNLPGWPGAPGCTMGADCCAEAAIALSKKSEAVRDRLQRAMSYYTTHVLGPSIPMERFAPRPILANWRRNERRRLGVNRIPIPYLWTPPTNGVGRYWPRLCAS